MSIKVYNIEEGYTDNTISKKTIFLNQTYL